MAHAFQQRVDDQNPEHDAGRAEEQARAARGQRVQPHLRGRGCQGMALAAEAVKWCVGTSGCAHRCGAAAYNRVLWDDIRTLWPTTSPASSARSAATRWASEIALIRRGCVTSTETSAPLPALMALSMRYCGIWVDLPLPVSPAEL